LEGLRKTTKILGYSESKYEQVYWQILGRLVFCTKVIIHGVVIWLVTTSGPLRRSNSKEKK
jgi:hypothetical protein